MLVLVSISVCFQIFSLNEIEWFSVVKLEVIALISGSVWIKINTGRRLV